LPESFCSIGEIKSLSRVLCLLSVLLPESFRGGCSFGAIVL
jgi:hypothetical protein